jgi:hypothetical protein
MNASSASANSRRIDQLMEKASRLLIDTDYFDAEAHCSRALALALAARDFERMSRICLPLQEARRQRRHEAVDAPGEYVISTIPAPGERISPGKYLLTPPLVGIHARQFRDAANRQKSPTLVLVREPTTRSGRWPIVGVGTGPREPFVVRVQVDVPPNLNGANGTQPHAPDATWFMATQELLGDAALLKSPRGVPADHHVEDLMDALEAVPEHEKLIQALAQACRDAVGASPAPAPRRRPFMDNPNSF